MGKLPQIKYYPNGYQNLGLQARTLKVRYRSNANVRTLRKRLEHWEHQHGNPLFEARHLEKLDVRLAHELVNVYVALRERYPQVRVDFIEFAGKDGDDCMAVAWQYAVIVPTAQTFMRAQLEHKYLDAQELLDLAWDSNMDSKAYNALHGETAIIHKDLVLDPTASGYLEFFTLHTKREHQKIVEQREKLTKRDALLGLTPRVLEITTSVATNTLIHEFGHLLEIEILKSGYKATEKVYRRLSEFMFESKNPKATQWRYHLINYPAAACGIVKGTGEGGELRKRSTRRALHNPIRRKLGRYATRGRDDLFAEAFAFAYSGGTRTLRKELNPFLIEIHRQGIGRKPTRKM